MTSYLAFCRKEFMENWRTYRLLIMLAVFAAFGLMSPLTAKMLPDLLSSMDLNGVQISAPESTAFDSWTQFFKNNGQMGMLVLIIVYCGITANEFTKATLIPIVTKGMQRRWIILAKFSVSVLIWTVAYAVSLAVTWAYTIYFWGKTPLPYAGLAFVSLWLFGVLMIVLLILGGICLGNIYGALLFSGGAVIVMALVSIAPPAARYNPISLAGGVVNLLNGGQPASDFIPALLICIALIVVGLAASLLIFDRKQL